MEKLPKVAIVGRVNTGKSTLLNKLVGQTRAIVSRLPGTTRDKIEAKCIWQGEVFELIDTGGLISEAKTELEKNVKLQTEKAIELADIILFVVDVREGINPQDIQIASHLRKSKKKIILVVNKVDSPKYRVQVEQFYKLGFKEIWPVSAALGIGCGDLLDKILKELPKYKEVKIKEKVIKVGICGKINVGKSSLFNSLLGRKEVIVSKEPGTTRDITYATLEYKGQKIELADSAGIKRKAKIKEEIERLTTRASLNLIRKSNLVLFVLDSLEPISRQDIRIANFVQKYKKNIILVVNKWDQTKKKIKMDKYIRYLQNRFSFLYYAPVIFVSAKTGENVQKICDLIIDVVKESEKLISQEDLLIFKQEITKRYPPPTYIFKIGQTGISPPQFAIYVKEKKLFPYSYLRLLKKQLRARFGFEGVPIKLNLSDKHYEVNCWSG